MDAIREQMINLISDKGCGLVEREHIHDGSLLVEIGIDSLRLMELVVLVEESLHIVLPDEYLDLSGQSTVRELINIVEDCYRLQK